MDRSWLSLDMLWALGSLCQLNKIPFDPALVTHQHPPPYTESTFIEAASTLGFKVGRCDTTHRKLAELTLPFVALLREPATAASANLALVIKRDGERLLYYRAQNNTAENISISEFNQRFEPVVLLVAHEAQPLSPDDDLWSRDPKKFGFRWFLPELLKHKSIWRDVLIATLVLQLVGLTTPLFTQVIIDKVVVHQSQSTLIAIGVGLVIFLIFNAFLTWLRQYFILHTGNRIDAVLGSQVFRHLVRLHLRYFEQRPTGTLIARLQGVETVRQFISGAAVTLFLDLPFLFVFLAVMFWYSWQLSLIAVATVALLAILSVSSHRCCVAA